MRTSATGMIDRLKVISVLECAIPLFRAKTRANVASSRPLQMLCAPARPGALESAASEHGPGRTPWNYDLFETWLSVRDPQFTTLLSANFYEGFLSVLLSCRVAMTMGYDLDFIPSLSSIVVPLPQSSGMERVPKFSHITKKSCFINNNRLLPKHGFSVRV